MNIDARTHLLREIGARIRDEREYLGLSREKFAEIVDLSPFYIGQIERGERSMSMDTLIKVSHSLKLSIDYILKGEMLHIDNAMALEDIGNYHGGKLSPEVKELIEVISKFPEDKIYLIKDITKLILPHIK